MFPERDFGFLSVTVVCVTGEQEGRRGARYGADIMLVIGGS